MRFLKLVCKRDIKILTVLFCLSLSVLNLGCSLHNSLVSLPKRYSGAAKVERIYIYSFLDFRSQTIGPKLLAEFKTEIESSMRTRGIETRQLWFNDSPVRKTFSFSDANLGHSRTYVDIPVKEVILANLDEEKEFHPTHLLTLFPSDVTVRGSGVDFDTKMTLINPTTLKEEWSAMISSHFSNQMTKDEIPKERAGQLAKFITDTMSQFGVF
jgi:hypothetical protein